MMQLTDNKQTNFQIISMQIFYLLLSFRKKLCVVTLRSFLNFSSLKLFSLKGILLKQGKVIVCVIMVV